MTRCLPNVISIAIVMVALSTACGRELVASSGSDSEERGSADGDTGEPLDPTDPLACDGPIAPTFPIPLVAGQMQPANFVRVGERVYWADGWDPWGDELPFTTVYRADMATNDPWIAIAEDQPGVNRMISDGEFVYWVVEGHTEASGQLLRANLDDEVEILDTNLLVPQALTFDELNNWIYYGEGDYTHPVTRLLRVRPDGSDKQLIVEHPGEIEDVEVDETHIWWISTFPDAVQRMPIGGGEPEFLGEVTLDRFDVSDGVGWGLGYIGIYRIRVGEEPYFITGHTGPRAIAVDHTHVYTTKANLFEDTHLGWIHRYPKFEGDYDPLAGEFATSKASPKPTSVRVDEHAIYWSTADEESGDGGIWMLCKAAL